MTPASASWPRRYLAAKPPSVAEPRRQRSIALLLTRCNSPCLQTCAGWAAPCESEATGWGMCWHVSDPGDPPLGRGAPEAVLAARWLHRQAHCSSTACMHCRLLTCPRCHPQHITHSFQLLKHCVAPDDRTCTNQYGPHDDNPPTGMWLEEQLAVELVFSRFLSSSGLQV